MSKVLNTIMVRQNENFFHMRLTNSKKDLLIEKLSGKITEVTVQEVYLVEPTPYSQFLGILNVLKVKILVFCKACTLVARLPDSFIYKIDSISLLPLRNSQILTSGDYSQQIIDLKKFLTDSMYFSIGGDLSLNLQARIAGNESNSIFLWNNRLLQELEEQNISKTWRNQMIQGYVEQFDEVIAKQKITYILISRRSYLMGGIKQYCCGVDDEGNVANFIETEQLVIIGEMIYSSVGVRGSVPLFWIQGGITNSTKLTRSFDLTTHPFNKHLDNLIKQYGKIFCVNLMSGSKTDEQVLVLIHKKILIEQFEAHMQSYKNQYAKYYYVDFYQICGRNSYNKINSVVQQMENVVANLSIYCYNLKSAKIISDQQGVFRLNCLDCTDRTDAFMSKLFFLTLSKHLTSHNIDLKQVKNQSPIIFQIGYDQIPILDLLDQKKGHDLIFKFNAVWQNNSNTISNIYVGTDSNQKKQGKQSIFNLLSDGLTSLNRLVVSTFESDYRQETTEILLNGFIEARPYVTEVERMLQMKEYLLQILHKIRNEFAQLDQLNVLLVTWNVNGKIPQHGGNLKIFDIEDKPIPCVIVIGLQEIVTLNPQNVMIMSNESVIADWDILISQNLKQYGSYTKVASATLVGIYISVLVLKQEISRVTMIEVDILKTGLGGTLGNKGATGIRFNLNQSKFTFINCHLSAGQKNCDVRLQEMCDIQEKLFFKKRQEISQYTFFMGDLNFRVDSSYQQVLSMIQQYQQIPKNTVQSDNILWMLVDQDQLNRAKESHRILKKFQEGQITFPPTYKFDAGTDVYDTSKKQRTPSWCDRILYMVQGDGQACQHFYKSRQSLESDHKYIQYIFQYLIRPVVSYFTVQVKAIDQNMRNSVKTLVIKERHMQQSENLSIKGVNQNQNQSSQIQPKNKMIQSVNVQNTSELDQNFQDLQLL